LGIFWDAIAERPITIDYVNNNFIKLTVAVKVTGYSIFSKNSSDETYLTVARVGFRNSTMGEWGTWFATVDFYNDGHIYLCGRKRVGEWRLYEWYLVELKVDLSSKRYYVYINGEYLDNSTTCNPQVDKIAAIGLTAGQAAAVVYFDNVKVEEWYEPIPFPALLGIPLIKVFRRKKDSG